MKENELTIREKIEVLFKDTQYNKKNLCITLGISRPTLDTRLKYDNWKQTEVFVIEDLYRRMLCMKPRNRYRFGEVKRKKYVYKEVIPPDKLMDDIWNKLSKTK